MYAAKTAAAAAANFHHSPTSTDGSSQGLSHFRSAFPSQLVLPDGNGNGDILAMTMIVTTTYVS